MMKEATTENVIDKYGKLEARVLECLEEEAEALRQKMRTRRFALRLTSLMSYFIAFWLGLVVLAPALATQFNQWAANRPRDAWYDTILEMQSATVTIAFSFWIFSLALSGAYLLVHARNRPYVLLLAFIINPLWLAGAECLINIWAGSATVSSFIQTCFFVGSFLMVLSLMLIGLMLIISQEPLTPTTLVLALTVGRRDKIASQVLNKVQGDYQEVMAELYPQQLTAIVDRRAEDINLQVQGVSFILGTVGLAGLLALFVSEEDMGTGLNSLAGYFGQLSGSPVGATVLSALTVILLFILIACGVWYFTQSYKRARALEIIRILCASDIPAQDATDAINMNAEDSSSADLAGQSDIGGKAVTVFNKDSFALIAFLLLPIFYVLGRISGRRD